MEELVIPTHIGIIMDGNGRWAKSRGLPRSLGHKEGAKTLKKLCKYIFDKKVKYLSVYAFSTENFKRDIEEVEYLMNLFVDIFTKEFDFLKKLGVRIIFSGREEGLPKKVLDSIHKMEEETKDNTAATFNICLNYGGQDEIVDMVKKISNQVLDGKIKIEEIDKRLVEDNMYKKLPPLDLVIRTSGEQRISNFMLWQSSYAEYYFPEVYFPDFNTDEFDKAIIEYNSRNRRFGGIKK